MKELDSALEVIIISGYAHFEYAQQAISYGVGHYLLKPVNKGELTATLQKLQKKIGGAQGVGTESSGACK